MFTLCLAQGGRQIISLLYAIFNYMCISLLSTSFYISLQSFLHLDFNLKEKKYIYEKNLNWWLHISSLWLQNTLTYYTSTHKREELMMMLNFQSKLKILHFVKWSMTISKVINNSLTYLCALPERNKYLTYLWVYINI